MKTTLLKLALVGSLLSPLAFATDPGHAAVAVAKPSPKDKTLLAKKPKPANAVAEAKPETIGAAEFGPASKKEIKDVKLSESIKADIGGQVTELKRATSGLRQKKVALFWASVYVNQVFTNGSVDFSSIAKVRESLVAGLPVMVTMTFVRDIPIDKIVDGYKEVFEANGVKADQAPYSDFLAAIKKSGDIKDKQTYYFTFAKSKAGKDLFSFWTNGKERFALSDAGSDGLHNFLGMWFGKATDSGLEQLQEEMLKHE
jgi:hypothetical protein